ncbi:hypothetical protein [Streptomyces sp. NPDC048636]|uniref:hypothetical protein n=1 Tax=Streptomyces sp. NPDC048636 TaxID=3155762 RepID=UPI0034184610
MRKNIRRSLLVAAAATGIWALGTAAASADELPAVPSTDSVTSTVDGVGETAKDTASTGGLTDTSGVTDTAKKTVGGAPSTVADTVKGGLPATDGLPGVPDASGTVDGVTGGATADADADKVAKKAAKKADKAVQKAKKATDLDLPTGEVPGVVPQIPALGSLPTVPDTSALPAAGSVPSVDGTVPAELPAELPATPKPPAVPGSADDLLGALGGAGVRPEQLTGKAQAAADTARPAVDGAASDVLPPAAHRIVVKVVPVAQLAVGDAGVLAGDAVDHTTPYAGYVTGSAQGHVLGTASNVVPFARDTAAGAVPVARSVVVTTVPFARDLATGTVPFAQGLGTSVAADAQVTVGNAADGAKSLLPAVPTDLTEAANIPALPVLPAVPADVPTVPADVPTVPADLPAV